MDSELKFNRKAIQNIAAQCYEHVNSSSNRRDALSSIALTATKEFGGYFDSLSLEQPDEIYVNFIELLDQIVFEIDENDSGETSIREYIIDDLYQRITIYLEIIKDEELYRQGLNNRLLCNEDTIIIRHYKMLEYIPELLREFQEQPNLQKAIIKCLLAFNAEDLLNFYYQIAQGHYCTDIKALALIGLKGFSGRFSNWHKLKTTDDDTSSLISYVEGFNTDVIAKNPLPFNLNTLYFTINFIELNLEKFNKDQNLRWIFKVFKCFLEVDVNNTFFTSIYTSISNILLGLDIASILKLVSHEKDLISFIYFSDLLPAAIFNRISVKLDSLNSGFLERLQDIINSEKVILDEVNSNISSYLLWNSSRGIL